MPEITRPILHDFLAGVDPTGTHTFQYGMQDEQTAGGSKARQLVNTAGGVLGGAAIIPAAIGGVVGGVKGLATGKGGVGSRLAYAGKSAFTGAKQPYMNLVEGLRGRSLLKGIQHGVPLTPKQRGAAKSLAGRMVPTQFASMPGARETAHKAVLQGLEGASPQQLAEARRFVGGEVAAGAGALGLSGLINSLSAHQQYAKGQTSQQEMVRQFAPQMQKTSAFLSGARTAFSEYKIL